MNARIKKNPKDYVNKNIPKYTAGPWYITDYHGVTSDNHFDALGNKYTSDVRIRPSYDGSGMHAEYPDGYCTYPETAKGNANLMCASLDMYFALKDALKLIDYMMPFIGKMSLPDYQLLNEAPIKARRAIAKAEGQQIEGRK